jgi:Dolichyl-phosphate-mannose-protein mannosyltransferase
MRLALVKPEPSATRSAPRSISSILLEASLVLTVLAVAATMRAINLGGYGGDLDEGIMAMKLKLAGVGFRLYYDLYHSEAPLLLTAWYPLFWLYAGTIEAVRFAVGTYSLLGLGGVYWIGRRVAGPVGAIAAILFLALSPTYLRISRQALAEMVAIAPAVLAVGAAVSYQRRGQRRWLVAAGTLLGASLAIKPIALAAAVPVALAVLLRGRRAWRDLLTVGLVAALVVVVSALVAGLDGVLGQTVEYRLRARESEGWRLRDNWEILSAALERDQLAIFGLALIGALMLLLRPVKPALPLVGWVIAGFGLLLVYTPLFSKHAATIMPPVALLAGAGLGRIWQLARQPGGRWRHLRAGMLPLIVWYAASLPAIVDLDLDLAHVGRGGETPDFSVAQDVVGSIVALTAPGDFVLTDHPYLAFMADRLVPPWLVDPSKTRIRSRELTGSEITTAATAYPSPVAVLWTERFRSLGGFRDWFEERYRPIKIYGRKQEPSQYIYLRRDADGERARAALTAGLAQDAGAEFAGQLRLGRFGITPDEVSPGRSAALTSEWQALEAIPVEYHVMMRVVGPDGQVRDEKELSLSDRREGTAGWKPGEWVVLVLTINIPEDAPPGDYRVLIALYDADGQQPAPVTRRAATGPALVDREVPLATLRVS